MRVAPPSMSGVSRREEASPLEGPAFLLARAPRAGARSTGWQLGHEGVPVAVEGGVEGTRDGGEPYTNAEVARMTLGDLFEEDVEGIRTGDVSDPSVGQVAVLASVFGVEPSYLLDRG